MRRCRTDVEYAFTFCDHALICHAVWQMRQYGSLKEAMGTAGSCCSRQRAPAATEGSPSPRASLAPLPLAACSLARNAGAVAGSSGRAAGYRLHSRALPSTATAAVPALPLLPPSAAACCGLCSAHYYNQVAVYSRKKHSAGVFRAFWPGWKWTFARDGTVSRRCVGQ